MDLLPTDEQSELISVVRDVLSTEMPPALLREPLGAEQVRARWRRIAELGWLGMAVPEELGGVGYGPVEEMMLFRELGRSVAPGAFLPVAVACRLGVEAADAELLAGLASGERQAAIAVARDEVTIGEERVAGRFLVAEGDDAELLLVLGDGLATLVRAPERDVRTAIAGIDEATPLADVYLDAEPKCAVRGAAAQRVRERGVILSAAILAGIAEATRDMSVEYAKVRHQFNRPIGTFQAVSRRCADMAVRAWNASSLVELAALCVATERSDHAFQAAAAQTVAGEAATRNCADNIQNLGAIGFTAEHDAHFYFKRARAVQILWRDGHANTGTLLRGYAPGMGLGV